MSNKERIEKIYALNGDLQVLLDKESDLYKLATNNRKNTIKITRNGKEVEATEGEMFEEIRIVGLSGEAGTLMKAKYPDLFTVAEEREAKNQELHTFIQTEFGFDFRQMGIADYLKLTEAVIDAKMGK